MFVVLMMSFNSVYANVVVARNSFNTQVVLHYYYKSHAALVTCLRFASVEVRLNENFAKRHIFTDVTERWFHRFASTQDTHSTQLMHRNI